MIKHNKVWVDDQGGVKATKRIHVGEDLFLSYEEKRRLLQGDRKPKARATAELGGTGTTTAAETMGVANVARRMGAVESRVAKENPGEQKLEEGPRKKKK